MAFIKKDFIDRLLQLTSLHDVVSSAVDLKRVGNGKYKGCCPFHGEKTPSFFIDDNKKVYYCFGCKAKGSIVQFYKDYYHLDFLATITDLARRMGMEVEYDEEKGLPGELAAQRLEKQKVEQDLKILNFVDKLYQYALGQNQKAKDYLISRQISVEMANFYHIGYAPDNNFLCNLAKDPQRFGTAHPLEQLKRTVLVKASDQNPDRLYDVFRERIMFPIFNTSGEVVGFGGRTIVDHPSKYINSSNDSTVYNKSLELYGLYQVITKHRELRKKIERIILVEGYLDVISLSQFGIFEGVAASGTAIQEGQLRQIYRNTDKLVMCFDGDSPGRNAAYKSLIQALTVITDEKQLSVVFLPNPEDPDSYLKKFGVEQFNKFLGNAQDCIKFLIDHELEQTGYKENPSEENSRKLLDIMTKHYALLSDKAYIYQCDLLTGVTRYLNLPYQDVEHIFNQRKTQILADIEVQKAKEKEYKRLSASLQKPNSYTPPYVQGAKSSQPYKNKSNYSNNQFTATKDSNSSQSSFNNQSSYNSQTNYYNSNSNSPLDSTTAHSGVSHSSSNAYPDSNSVNAQGDTKEQIKPNLDFQPRPSFSNNSKWGKDNTDGNKFSKYLKTTKTTKTKSAYQKNSYNQNRKTNNFSQFDNKAPSTTNLGTTSQANSNADSFFVPNTGESIVASRKQELQQTTSSTTIDNSDNLETKKTSNTALDTSNVSNAKLNNSESIQNSNQNQLNSLNHNINKSTTGSKVVSTEELELKTAHNADSAKQNFSEDDTDKVLSTLNDFKELVEHKQPYKKSKDFSNDFKFNVNQFLETNPTFFQQGFSDLKLNTKKAFTTNSVVKANDNSSIKSTANNNNKSVCFKDSFSTNSSYDTNHSINSSVNLNNNTTIANTSVTNPSVFANTTNSFNPNFNSNSSLTSEFKSTITDSNTSVSNSNINNSNSTINSFNQSNVNSLFSTSLDNALDQDQQEKAESKDFSQFATSSFNASGSFSNSFGSFGNDLNSNIEFNTNVNSTNVFSTNFNTNLNTSNSINSNASLDLNTSLFNTENSNDSDADIDISQFFTDDEFNSQTDLLYQTQFSNNELEAEINNQFTETNASVTSSDSNTTLPSNPNQTNFNQSSITNYQPKAKTLINYISAKVHDQLKPYRSHFNSQGFRLGGLYIDIGEIDLNPELDRNKSKLHLIQKFYRSNRSIEQQLGKILQYFYQYPYDLCTEQFYFRVNLVCQLELFYIIYELNYALTCIFDNIETLTEEQITTQVRKAIEQLYNKFNLKSLFPFSDLEKKCDLNDIFDEKNHYFQTNIQQLTISAIEVARLYILQERENIHYANQAIEFLYILLQITTDGEDSKKFDDYSERIKEFIESNQIQNICLKNELTNQLISQQDNTENSSE